MKLETILAGYFAPDCPRIGYMEAVLSPDGWDGTVYHPDSRPLLPDEIVEFSAVIGSFFRRCNTQNELKKFCQKYGTDTDAVTYSFCFDCALMTYVLHVTGYSAVFACYRKENVQCLTSSSVVS